MKLELSMNDLSSSPADAEGDIKIISDMYEELDLWGAWAAGDSSGVDWKPVAAGFKGLLPHGKKSRPQCTDDKGIIIDSCIARLRRYKPEEYELIVAHFVIGISLRAIAKKRKCSDGTIRKELQTAMGFICGCLYMLPLYLT